MFGKLIDRPIAVSMTIIAIMVLGAVAIWLLPVSLMPSVNIPQITVQINAQGYSAREVNDKLLKPLKYQLMQLPSLKDLRCEANNNSGNIFLGFSHGSDVDFLFVEANEFIDRALSGMPKDIERPKVIKASATDIPAFFVNITADSTSTEKFLELSRFSSDVISKRIEQIPEVAIVDASGLSLPEILITPDRAKLTALGISSNDLESAVENNNLKLGNLSIKDGHYLWDIRFMTEIKSKEDIENINLNINGRIYKFSELANVLEKPRELKGLIRLNGNRSIMLAIIKQSDAKMSNLKKSLNTLMDTFGKEYPGIHFSINRDQTQLLDYTISNLRSNIIIGAFLAILIIFLFLNDFRSPLLITITIPLSLIISLLFFYLVNISINVISLSGLILGIGMMVDNSIIVIDNITQKKERGDNLRNSVIKGVSEVVAPMISSVLTTCAVFVPLVFLSGIAGALFYDQAMGVTIGLFSSLAVAILVIPVYYYLFYRTNGEPKPLKFLAGIKPHKYQDAYEKGLKWVLRHQRLMWVIFLLSIPSSYLLFRELDKSKLPPVTHDDTIMLIDWNSPVSLDENDSRSSTISKCIDSLISDKIAIIGLQQFLLPHTPELTQSGSMLYIKAKSAKKVAEIENILSKSIIRLYPDATFKFAPSDNIFNLIFQDKEYNFVVKIRDKQGKSADPDKLNQFLEKISALNPEIYIEPVLWQEQILYKINPELLVLYKLNYVTVYNALKSATKEKQLFAINQGTYSVPMIMGLADNSFENMLSITVTNSDGIEIPLSTVISETRVRDLKTIVSGTEGDFYPLNISLPDRDVKKTISSIDKIVKVDENFDAIYSGSYFSNREMINELFIILVVAFLLLFFILAAQFESLIQPLIILSEIFVDIFGAFLFLWLFGSGLNLMSMIGLVVMCGIVINDSILKVDTINRLRKEGYSLLRAIMAGGTRRLKPIIMTSLTTIFAIAPFLVRGNLGSDLQFPLSIALIGGMIVGTVVSVFFIPVFYYTIYNKSKK